MTSSEAVAVTRWQDLPLQQLRGTMSRRFVTSSKLMLAQINFRKGDVVPAHRHPNEQFTYVVSGTLRFYFGDDQRSESLVRAGEVVVIPSNLLHSATAIEDTFELDIFSPPRADWIDGSDTYLTG